MLTQQMKKTIRSITPPVIMDLISKVIGQGRHRHGQGQMRQKHTERVQSDEYISWLCQVVGGFLHPEHGNIAAFDYAIEHMPNDGAVLEIGSFLGMSTNIIAYLSVKHGRRNPFFSCDPWRFEETDRPVGGYFEAGSGEFRDYVMSTFAKSAQTFSKDAKPYAIEATSGDFLAMWRSRAVVKDVFGREITLGGPIAFAYVDGAHTYQGARDDFLGIDPFLVAGGCILFDDTSDCSRFECKKIVAEVLSNPAYELVFKTPNYLFRKKS